MDLLEAIKQRHSVRAYKDQALPDDVKKSLEEKIEECNKESGLHVQLVTNEPKAFAGLMARYGSFAGVTNYIALIGKKDSKLDEKCGYYGEKLVLYAQQLGLNTCWVGATYSKIPEAFNVAAGEKLALVISVGYGENQGVPHKSKSLEKVCDIKEDSPNWYKKGMEAVLLAPTAVNQQKFYFSVDGNRVSAKAGLGFYAKVDLGIAKYHFEVGAGKENFEWQC